MIKIIEDYEIDEVMNIWLITNIKAHSFLPKKYWKANYMAVKERYMPISTTFIYKEEEIIKGFVSVIDHTFIGALFVLDEYKGHGIGKKLLNHCKEVCSKLELCVYEKNEAAVEFYKNLEFVTIAKQPNGDTGFKEYVMAWSKE